MTPARTATKTVTKRAVQAPTAPVFEVPNFNPEEPEVAPKNQASKLAPTPQQGAFLQELTTGSGHLVLQARAGCGKTTAILMGVDAIISTPKLHSSEIAVVAYNKAIADEVSAKLKARSYDWRQVQACTLHSLGFGLLRSSFSPQVDDKKISRLIDAKAQARFPESDDYLIYRAQIIKLVRYAKQAGVGFFDDEPIGDPTTWYRLIDHFDINGFDNTYESDKVVTLSQTIYKDSLADTSTIDFDDMILLPLIKSLRVKYTKDFVFLDEAQDLSRARQALARKFVKPNTGRMIVVGDDRQAIYGFSGADSAALPNLTRALDAITLPLSVTWRCPKSVVRVANTYVPDLQAADTAPEGEVLHLATLPPDLTKEDAILCRNTAPLITLAYTLIRKGTACKVEGRAIGEGLTSLARKWKIRETAKLVDKLEEYKDREVQKALAKGNEQRAADVEDKVLTLLEVIKGVNDQGRWRVDDVITFIESLFADGAANVLTLATYHRSKGREWKRVFLYEHFLRCPSRAARQAWQKEQESNLAYVAITRAKEVLAFVG